MFSDLPWLGRGLILPEQFCHCHGEYNRRCVVLHIQGLCGNTASEYCIVVEQYCGIRRSDLGVKRAIVGDPEVA